MITAILSLSIFSCPQGLNAAGWCFGSVRKTAVLNVYPNALGSAWANALGRGTESVNEAAPLYAAPMGIHDTFTASASCDGRRVFGGEA